MVQLTRILNIDALEKLQGFGYATKVVDPAEMTLQHKSK